VTRFPQTLPLSGKERGENEGAAGPGKGPSAVAVVRPAANQGPPARRDSGEPTRHRLDSPSIATK